MWASTIPPTYSWDIMFVYHLDFFLMLFIFSWCFGLYEENIYTAKNNDHAFVIGAKDEKKARAYLVKIYTPFPEDATALGSSFGAGNFSITNIFAYEDGNDLLLQYDVLFAKTSQSSYQTLIPDYEINDLEYMECMIELPKRLAYFHRVTQNIKQGDNHNLTLLPNELRPHIYGTLKPDSLLGASILLEEQELRPSPEEEEQQQQSLPPSEERVSWSTWISSFWEQTPTVDVIKDPQTNRMSWGRWAKQTVSFGLWGKKAPIKELVPVKYLYKKTYARRDAVHKLDYTAQLLIDSKKDPLVKALTHKKRSVFNFSGIQFRDDMETGTIKQAFIQRQPYTLTGVILTNTNLSLTQLADFFPWIGQSIHTRKREELLTQISIDLEKAFPQESLACFRHIDWTRWPVKLHLSKSKFSQEDQNQLTAILKQVKDTAEPFQTWFISRNSVNHINSLTVVYE